MAVVKFELDLSKADEKLQRQTSNMDIQKFNSAAPTLNNTPTVSRSPSPVRKKVSTRSPTPAPKQGDIEDLEKGDKQMAKATRYTNHELSIHHMGSIIITCFFTSGLIDAVAFNSWSCFVGMQTGNTVFAALGLGGLPESAHEQQYIKSFVAIGSFCLGTIFFNAMHRYPTGIHIPATSRRRIILVLSFLIQSLLVMVAAALVTTGMVSNKPFVQGTFSSGSSRLSQGRHYLDLIAIFILAFEAAGQVCLSRCLSLIELPTIVLSTLYHDWCMDALSYPHLWRESSSFRDFISGVGRRQNKRLVSILALFLGGVVGGEMYKSKVGMAGALWLAASLKFAISMAFAVWKKEKDEDRDSEK